MGAFRFAKPRRVENRGRTSQSGHEYIDADDHVLPVQLSRCNAWGTSDFGPGASRFDVSCGYGCGYDHGPIVFA
jgi:hypothetical protein